MRTYRGYTRFIHKYKVVQLGILNNCQFIIYVRYLGIQDLFEMTYGGHLILEMPFLNLFRTYYATLSIYRFRS